MTYRQFPRIWLFAELTRKLVGALACQEMELYSPCLCNIYLKQR